MYKNIENLEKINYAVLRSKYILAENLYTNRFDMPISRADLAFFEENHLYILLYNNGSEFGLRTIELSNMQKHTALSTDDKKRLISEEIDSFNDGRRNPEFFDDYRFFEPIHITQSNDMEVDYYIVYSTNGEFHGNSILLCEVLKLFSAYWKSHIDEWKALPDSIYDNENQMLDFSIENAETIKMKRFKESLVGFRIHKSTISMHFARMLKNYHNKPMRKAQLMAFWHSLQMNSNLAMNCFHPYHLKKPICV